MSKGFFPKPIIKWSKEEDEIMKRQVSHPLFFLTGGN